MTTDGTQILEVLPGDLAACHALIAVQREQLDSATRRISTMEHQLQQLLHRLCGRSSEWIDPAQMAMLFAEMLKQLEAQNPPPEVAEMEAIAGGSKRNGHGRRRLPADLPRERVIHDLSEAEKSCPCCGTM